MKHVRNLLRLRGVDYKHITGAKTRMCELMSLREPDSVAVDRVAASSYELYLEEVMLQGDEAGDNFMRFELSPSKGKRRASLGASLGSPSSGSPYGGKADRDRDRDRDRRRSRETRKQGRASNSADLDLERERERADRRRSRAENGERRRPRHHRRSGTLSASSVLAQH